MTGFFNAKTVIALVGAIAGMTAATSESRANSGLSTEITYVSQPQEALILPDADDGAQKPVLFPYNDGDTTPPTVNSLADLVAMQPTDVTSDEMECLAGAVYFESKGESLAGQLAVAEVVIHRKNSGRFAPTICGVVYQPKQFSFVRGGKMPHIDRDSKAWRNAVAIAHIAMNDQWQSPVKGSLFFHATYVSPRWRLTRTGTIGNHIFYR